MDLLFPPKPSIFSPPDLSRSAAARAPPLFAARRYLRATSGDNYPAEEAAADDTAASSSNNTSSSKKSTSTQPLKIRYRTISKKQARKREEDFSAAAAPPTPPVKSWEEMSLGEKAIELYVGEKGLLFWLNKFAYASIFIIIGGWILFRFVGPSLGLYQLDGGPLSPSSLF